jgi:hypothetical protein
MTLDPLADHALHAKQPLFSSAGFYIVAVICFATWFFLSQRLRYWSLKQDETGAAECTYKMRFLACAGIFPYAFTLTFGAIMWMKALHLGIERRLVELARRPIVFAGDRGADHDDRQDDAGGDDGTHPPQSEPARRVEVTERHGRSVGGSPVDVAPSPSPGEDAPP